LKAASQEYSDLTTEYQLVVRREIRRLEAAVAPERHLGKMAEHAEFIKEQLSLISNDQAGYQELMQELESAIAAAVKEPASTGGKSPAAGTQKQSPESSSHPGRKQSPKQPQPEIAVEENMIKMNSIYGYPLIGFCCEDCENRGILKIPVDSHYTQCMYTTKNVVVKREAVASFNKLVRDREIELTRINYHNTEYLPVLVYFKNPWDGDIIRSWFSGLQESWKE